MKNFESFGVMIDMSRNAVMNLPSLKRFLTLLKKMGYNTVMLYTEDTYEVNDEPYFGYMRGRYSKAEMKEIDAFAAGLGMEVIPCIQTLAHAVTLKRWNIVPFDCNDIFMVDDPRTYELIDRMFATLSECFVSRKIHIGMDEAHMLGKGAHMDKYGPEDVSSIMKRHLQKVTEIAAKYGYETMVWSDMFFRPWNKGAYYAPKTTVPREYVDALPENVIPVYWDYYSTDEERYNAMFYNHKQLSEKTWFAGGVWSWEGFVPHNQFSLNSMIPALDSCRKNKIKNVVFTMWGDDGAECSHFAQLPALFYLAEYAKGNRDEEKIKKKFKSFCGIDFDAFMAIDRPNEIVPYTGHPQNPSKYMLYSDCFNDYLDYTVCPGCGRKYEEYAQEFHATAKKSRKYGYVFDTAAKLCRVMAIKYELGLNTRKAYEAGDKDALRKLAIEDYAKAIKLIDVFAKAFEKQWMIDNKPHGFDVQDLRLGGLIRRLDACRRRILDYVNGKIDCIEELDQPLLPYRQKEKSACLNLAPLHSTVNVLHHNSWTL